VRRLGARWLKRTSPDISYKRAHQPPEVINIGDTVKVQIVRINIRHSASARHEATGKAILVGCASCQHPVGTAGSVTNITEYARSSNSKPRRFGPRFGNVTDKEERSPVKITTSQEA
jgi:hypothetical protein